MKWTRTIRTFHIGCATNDSRRLAHFNHPKSSCASNQDTNNNRKICKAPLSSQLRFSRIETLLQGQKINHLDWFLQSSWHSLYYFLFVILTVQPQISTSIEYLMHIRLLDFGNILIEEFDFAFEHFYSGETICLMIFQPLHVNDVDLINYMFTLITAKNAQEIFCLDGAQKLCLHRRIWGKCERNKSMDFR